MTDRELLEMAAKAAGIAGGWDKYAKVFVPAEGRIFWNPLTDDGDALRLAVKLTLMSCSGHQTYTHSPDIWHAWAMTEAEAYYHSVEYSRSSGDPYAATRRAIVRAAAEIGGAMP